MGQTAIVNEFVDDKEAQFNFIQTWNSNNNGAVQNENENSTENNSYDEDGDNNN